MLARTAGEFWPVLAQDRRSVVVLCWHDYGWPPIAEKGGGKLVGGEIYKLGWHNVTIYFARFYCFLIIR